LSKTSFGCILSLRYVRIFEISVKFWIFLKPILAYLKGKNVDPYLVDFLLFGDQKCHFRNEPLNIRKTYLTNWSKIFVRVLYLLEKGHRIKTDFQYCERFWVDSPNARCLECFILRKSAQIFFVRPKNASKTIWKKDFSKHLLKDK
jgi:hypothetical protein